MTVTKLTLAALLLGASLTPALADPGPDRSAAPLTAYLASLHQAPATSPMIEGRQGAPVHATATETALDHYLNQRNGDAATSYNAR